MCRGRRALLVALLSAPGAVRAQDPVPPAADSAVVADTAGADSSATERLLAVEGQDRIRLRPMPQVTFGEVQPAGARIVLSRDSLDWAAARTVSELLAATANVYLWRGGWRVRPELPNYLGRGATSVEYLVDGRPWLPIGPDSLAVDPSLWSLEFFERVEIERDPARLRVHLYTRSHDRMAPRTEIAVATGDRGFARYLGAFEKRYPSGFGLTLAADYTGANAPDGGTGSASVTNGLVQLSYRPTTRLGAQLQVMVQAPIRDPLLDPQAESDTLDHGLEGTRTDAELRFSLRPANEVTGWRADAWAARTAWSGDTAAQVVGTFGAIVGYRRPTWSGELQALHHTEWTSLDARAALGWTPGRLITGAVEGVHQQHEDDRTSNWATARLGIVLPRGSDLLLGLSLPVGLRLGATVSHGNRVDVPSLVEVKPSSFTDYALTAALDAGRLTGEARWLSTDAWQPVPYRAFLGVPGFRGQPRTEWITASARFAPLSWFSIASHYEHPLGGSLPDGVPPHHAWTTATVTSRFLHNFPSGIFRLKVQGVLESWSPGVIGRDGEGAAIELPGLTFLRGIVQLQIGPFIAYWDRVNFQATRQGHVPGYPILSLGSSYGIRWAFSN
jgi:hypothetical protein